MADFMDMLSQSQQYSAQVMGLASAQIQSVARQKVQEKQFAASHAARMTQLAEQSRMNDAALVDSAFTNKIRAEEHAMNMDLAPLRMQEAHLRMESAKVNARRQIEDQSIADFDATVAPMDMQVGAVFAGNKNPEYAKEYLNLKSEWYSKARQGQPFNEPEYRQQVENLNNKYAGQTVKGSEYNGEVSFLLGKFDKNLQARYEANNPEFSGSIPGIKAGLLVSDERSFLTQLDKHGRLLGQDEIASISMARDAYQHYDNEVRRLSEEYTKANTVLMASDPEDEAIFANAKEIQAQIAQDYLDAVKQRKQIMNSVVGGKPIPVDPIDPAEISQAQRDAQSIKPTLDDENPINPFSSTPKDLRESAQRESRMNELRSVVKTKSSSPIDPLEGINLSDYYQIDDRSAVTKFFVGSKPSINVPGLRAQIYRNLEGVDDSDLMSLAAPEVVEEMLKGIKGKTVSVLARNKRDKFTIGGGEAFGEQITTFSPKDMNDPNRRGQNYVIRSASDIDKVLDNKNLSEYERRLLFIDLYTALVAASVEGEAQD